MPKRVIDFDAMWGSDKLASCAEWAQAEYAWLYGLADASGCFELTNLRVIWGRVAAIRRNLTIERLEQVFDEFQARGLLFVWEHEGKRYGHWTGSDVPGRLPPPSWRMRLERLAPPVPKQQFAEYVSRFARGRAALPGGSFRTEPESRNGQFENSNLKFERSEGNSHRDGGTRSPHASGFASLNNGLEEAQAQDWNWDLNLGGKGNEVAAENEIARGEAASRLTETLQPPPGNLNSNAERAGADHDPKPILASANGAERMGRAVPVAQSFQPRDKSLLVARELTVGRGPSCGPVKVKAEALERIQARNAARAGSRAP